MALIYMKNELIVTPYDIILTLLVIYKISIKQLKYSFTI